MTTRSGGSSSATRTSNFNTHVSTFDIAVSKTSSPATLGTADWNFYQINTTETGFDADYPGNFGYNHDAFVFTLNMFGVAGGGHVQVVSVNTADLANGVAPGLAARLPERPQRLQRPADDHARLGRRRPDVAGHRARRQHVRSTSSR